jgi:hypothetical protein
MRAAQEKRGSGPSRPAPLGKPPPTATSKKKMHAYELASSIPSGEQEARPCEGERDIFSTREDARRVGVLPLVDGALDVGDDGRAIVWLDIGA